MGTRLGTLSRRWAPDSEQDSASARHRQHPVRPGSVPGYDTMGDKVWNEDPEDQPEHEQYDSSEDQAHRRRTTRKSLRMRMSSSSLCSVGAARPSLLPWCHYQRLVRQGHQVQPHLGRSVQHVCNHCTTSSSDEFWESQQ
eukprot:817665-Rhodomonas_salina.3